MHEDGSAEVTSAPPTEQGRCFLVRSGSCGPPRKKPLQSLRVRGLCLSTFDLEPRQSLEVGALPVSGEL